MRERHLHIVEKGMTDQKLELRPREVYALLRDDGLSPHEALDNVIPLRRRIFSAPKRPEPKGDDVA